MATQTMVGGLGEAKPATAEVQEFVDKVRTEVEKQTEMNYGEFVAVSYKSQVVAGTNYFVKVKVGPEDFIHLRIFVSLPHAGSIPEVVGVQVHKREDDSITYF